MGLTSNMTGVLIREDFVEKRHIKVKAMRRPGPGLECCIYKSGNTKEVDKLQKLEETRKDPLLLHSESI